MNQENKNLLELLLQSDNIVVERNDKSITMPNPKEVYERFSDAINTEDIRIELGDRVLIEEDGEIKTAYDKYLFTADLGYDIEFPNISHSHHTAKVGLLICNRSNQMKIFSGMEARACLNMSVFGADSLQEEKIILGLIKPNIEQSVKVLDNKYYGWKDRIVRLNTTIHTEESLEKRLGKLLLDMPSKLFSYIKHCKDVMVDKNSLYFDMPDSDWKLLSGMTDLNKNRGMKNRINEIIELESYFV